MHEGEVENVSSTRVARTIRFLVKSSNASAKARENDPVRDRLAFKATMKMRDA